MRAKESGAHAALSKYQKIIRPLKRRQWSFCGFAEGKEANAEWR